MSEKTVWVLLFEDGLMFVNAASAEEAEKQAQRGVDKLGPFKEAITKMELEAALRDGRAAS